MVTVGDWRRLIHHWKESRNKLGTLMCQDMVTEVTLWWTMLSPVPSSLCGSMLLQRCTFLQKHFSIIFQVGNTVPQQNTASLTLGWHQHCALSKEAADVRELGSFSQHLFTGVSVSCLFMLWGKKMSLKWESFFNLSTPTVVKPAAKISPSFNCLNHSIDDYRNCYYFFIISTGELPKPVFQ